ncbi:ATPase, F0 complex, subunit B, bacterial [Candidatus Omnitrophus magneticus]|uniref:ATP synthase subunit b n=1 Tax=Candidatus Omnitrophus magneticus TaxID=1609969 RepID=A0A0F0CWY7_9BACT|nr:ATPase, F0 complex, subunit B, bacterial [Candidatus Omnitrophus magneticus]
MEILKLLNVSEIAAQLACFFILLFVLNKFLWPRILAVLDERRSRISSEFKKIEELKTEVDVLKNDYIVKTREIEAKVQEKIAEAIQKGHLIAEEMKLAAQEESKNSARLFQEQMEIELLKAKEDMKKTIVEFSIEAAEKIIKDKISIKQEDILVEEFLEGIERIK